MLYYLQRLGFMLGMMMTLNPYNIRRGAGEGVQDVATQGQLQQVMGHKDAGIFQAYINERVQCDVQAAFLGRPCEQAIFRSLGHMSRDIDPRAPTQLTNEYIDELKQHPLIVEFRERRDALSKAVKDEHGTHKNARAVESETLKLYDQAKLDLESAKKRLKRGKLYETRKEFFENIETQDAQRQLGLAAIGLDEEWKSKEKGGLSPERKRVADLLCQNISGLDEKEKLQYRMKTIAAMWEMCRTPGVPTRRRTQSNHSD